MPRGKLAIFANRSGECFANKVLEEINKISQEQYELGKLNTLDFADGECKPVIKQSVRGMDVYIIQNCNDPNSSRSVHDNFFETCETVDAMIRAGAEHVTVVLPYHPFLRQDKQTRRESITARLAADFLTASGANAVISADMHTKQIEGFYKKTKTDNMSALKLFCEHIKANYDLKDFIVLAPDAGGSRDAKKMAENLGTDIAQAFKHRSYTKANLIENVIITGNIKDKNILIFDDMIDTAGTMKKLHDDLIQKGAKKVVLCSTHALLNGPAIDRLKDITGEIIITDTICRNDDFFKEHPRFKLLTIAPLFARVIYNINQNISVSEVYH